MKILVFAHRLELGGTQTNAIELAAALRDIHGHEVAVFATPGPMVRALEERRIRFLPAPDARIHPSVARMQALRETVRAERPDLIHCWDWWQCLDAYYSVHLPMRVPIIVTDMMMALTRVLPKELPTTFGTPELVDRARASGRRRVELLLPPVDVALNAPGAADGEAFRARHRVSAGERLVVTVSRLSEFLKSESLFRTVEAMRTVGRRCPVRLIVVGDGAVRATLQQKADAVNRDLGRAAVELAGALLDPRPAYDAADVVVGMGGSVLRGMAFAKPVIVVGEKGFCAPFTPRTAEAFLYKGMYGRGASAADDNQELIGAITEMVEEASRESPLGAFGRAFVVEHFSIEAVSAVLAELCQRSTRDGFSTRRALFDGLRTAAVYLRERRFREPSRDKDPALTSGR